MQKVVIGAGIGVWLALAGVAGAQVQEAAAPLVVVELFTSQGCSSCPPADALLREITADSGVLALSLHVDYWDYLGWVDALAKPAFSMRQKAYAYAAVTRARYTPQMVVGGAAELNGADREALVAQLERQAAAPRQVELRVQQVGAGWLIEITAEPPLESGAVVQIVRYLPEVEVTIVRGENAGREATYANVATEWLTVSEWDGRAPLVVEALAAGQARSAVIVQQLRTSGRYAALPGAILAAARLD